jgi:hypothetical protein
MIRDTGWFKSSHSGGADDQCVEVRIVGDDAVGVRDSKNTAAGALWITPTTWAAFVNHTTSGAFAP